MQSMMDTDATVSTVEPSRILIVEDESVIALNLQETLEALAYTVPAIAVSGEQAIRYTTEFHPNLVLMDIRIKGEMDGIQTAEQIWERFQIPVIYVTGHSDKSTVERARLTAPFGYLLKPIKERELYVAIESALQRCERERWMSTVLKGIGDAVIVVDVEGQIKFLNPVAEGMTGWQLQEVRDQPLMEIFEVVYEDTQLPIEDPIKTALQQGVTVHLEGDLLLIAKDGSSVPIADSVAPLRDSNGTITGVVLVFQNITMRRQAEERNRAIEQATQLQVQMAELERLNDLKDDFLSTVSHELRTPIANIKMAVRMLEIILDQGGVLSPENNPDFAALTQYLKILRDQSNQELYLVNDLLDLQRLSADRYDLELSSIPTFNWITLIIENLQARLQERQINLQLDLAPNLPPLLSDISSLNRIFTELLNNACKYTPPGEQITVTVRVGELKTLQVEGASPSTSPSFVVTICNTGVEIPAKELLRIFDSFYRIPKSDRWSQGGTGLGLALVKKLVARLNGSIQVESTSDQTCFIVELPSQQPL